MGKVMRPVTVVADAVQLSQAFHEDGNRIGDHTGRAAAGIADGWGGGVGGDIVGRRAYDWLKSWS